MRRIFLRAIVILVVFVMSAAVSSAGAAWWENQGGFPVPESTKELKKDNKVESGNAIETTHYESSLAASAVRDFYRKRLPALGWSFKDMAQEIRDVPALSLTKDWETFLGTNMFFEKEGETLFIAFAPAVPSGEGKLRYITAVIAPATEKEKSRAAQATDTLQGGIPVYPGANLISSTDISGSLVAAYTAEASSAKIIAYYKDKMLKAGWIMQGEQPPEPVDLGEDCPECVEFQAQMAKEMKGSGLNFVDRKGNTCEIALRTIESGTVGESDVTSIVINYYANKK